jgi:hypothetical protein
VQQTYEKLGAFYLGHPLDAQNGEASDAPLLVDSQRFVTHALCLGMTGSGKTGLCISLLEEAAIDGVPVIAIDPKGDLGNLLLTFPGLSAADYEPWVDPDEAARRGISAGELAEEKAAQARAGLAASHQDGERVARLRAAADFAIYTPGANAGLGLSVLRSLDLPPQAVLDDEELLQERIAGLVSGLLSLVGVTGDPLQSREHILLSKIVHEAFLRGESLSLQSLLKQVKTPPFAEVGVLDLESFFPEKERLKLVQQLNNLLASPAFAGFMRGDALDVQRLLYTEQGKPRVAIISIAHLDDNQRMFFVTLLLNEVLSWVRSQSGTTSLRALLYMDEVFGFFPPVAEPASKRPMLTLLKQARAFGLGVVLATQNPVDLDYRGLGNIGTWFIGRLQTERDRERVLDGLGSAAQAAGAGFDRGVLGNLLATLAPRTFLLHSARGGAPVPFKSRFALSFLRGPLTRAEIKRVMDVRKASSASADGQTVIAAPVGAVAASSAQGQPPVMPGGVDAFYAPEVAGDATRYEPHAFVAVKLSPEGLPVRSVVLHAPITDGTVPVDFEHAATLECTPDKLQKEPDPDLAFAPMPRAALDAKRYPAYAKDGLARALAAFGPVTYSSAAEKLKSEPGEDERAFRARVMQTARERRDEAVRTLTAKFEQKIARIETREQTLRQKLAREEAEATREKLSGALDVGSAILGAFFGRGVSKSTINSASKAARGVAKAAKEHGDTQRVAGELAEAEAERAALQAELEAAAAAIPQPQADEAFEHKVLKLKKADVSVVLSGLLFVPK